MGFAKFRQRRQIIDPVIVKEIEEIIGQMVELLDRIAERIAELKTQRYEVKHGVFRSPETRQGYKQQYIKMLKQSLEKSIRAYV